MRIGFAKDIHNLKSSSKKLVLGTIEIEDTPLSIEAISDGDIVVHAIFEAFIGALSLGTIGDFFPENSDKSKNISGTIILEKMLYLINKHSCSIQNIDVSIVLEKPLISKYLKMMCREISKIINIPENKISIKATRFEDPKSTKIECYAIILLF